MVGFPRALGLLATVAGLAGYVAGVFVAYPGRAFSLSVAMVGVTLVIIGDDWEVPE